VSRVLGSRFFGFVVQGAGFRFDVQAFGFEVHRATRLQRTLNLERERRTCRAAREQEYFDASVDVP
jgi:hypothetical protein